MMNGATSVTVLNTRVAVKTGGLACSKVNGERRWLWKTYSDANEQEGSGGKYGCEEHWGVDERGKFLVFQTPIYL